MPRTIARERRRYLLSALAFFAAAALCRMLLIATHSRRQVYAFIALAALYEFAAPRLWRQRPRLGAFLLNSACAALAIVTVKIALDRHVHVPRNIGQVVRLLTPWG